MWDETVKAIPRKSKHIDSNLFKNFQFSLFSTLNRTFFPFELEQKMLFPQRL